LEGEAWQRFFDDFERSAFRLETRQVYSVPQEAENLQRYLAGERLPAHHRSAWMDRVTGYVSTGRAISRVHVVERPLTDYLRFEFEWYYTFHVTVGEDIRILDLTGKPNPGLPDEDFWMFDDCKVVRMMYRENGTQIGRELIESPELGAYIGYRDMAMREAVPFREYWAELRRSARS
jgi:hypothetical protein